LVLDGEQEVDRNEDMLRSALRAIDALSRMPDVETCQRFQTFLTKTVLGDAAMAQRFKAVRSESDTTAVDATGMET
jgi:cullin-associated NEDD8-dissociated protein 1